MKSTGLIFGSSMVKALLDGTKTQTRRIIKPQPDFELSGRFPATHCSHHARPANSFDWKGHTIADVAFPAWCPYGVAGDRLWVRETWFDIRKWERETGLKSGVKEDVQYRADFPGDFRNVKWNPSIFMPRKFSRITLEITHVRVERLNSISEDAAMAEGITDTWLVSQHFSSDRIYGYKMLWESLHGEESWMSNPFVWVLEFHKL